MVWSEHWSGILGDFRRVSGEPVPCRARRSCHFPGFAGINATGCKVDELDVEGRCGAISRGPEGGGIRKWPGVMS